MAKKIKTFTTDEEVYNRLVSMFKKYKAETSISEFLNNKLKELLVYLEDIEKGINEMNYSIPMQFVIDDQVKGCENPRHLSNESDETPCISELEHILMFTEENYEADKKGVPREFYNWLEAGNFKLSEDKKFLIEKETKKKYISAGRNHLMEVREIDNKNFK